MANAFTEISAGLNDAISHAKGDDSKAVIVTIEACVDKVGIHRHVEGSCRFDRHEPSAGGEHKD